MIAGTLDALREEREFLLRSLDDLDREVAAGDLSPAEADELRDAYVTRLAEVQRAVEAGTVRTPAPAPASTGSARDDGDDDVPEGRRHGWGRRLVAGVIVLGLAGGAGIGVATSFGERRPGDTATGDVPRSTGELLDEAARLSGEGQVLEAIQTYDRVLERQPGNVEALAERGFLLLRVFASGGDAELLSRGRTSIDRALAGAPDDPRLLFYQGVGNVLAGEEDAAQVSFDRALANQPPDDVRRAIETFRAEAPAADGNAPAGG